ncbi:hypothetical protein BHE74_00015150 [Ensete ventricosum]|nr:hypothetical protein BHE74_00015150 [Ensete ventricosum]
MTSTLIGFTQDATASSGVVTLPMTFDEEPRTKTLMVSFMVVELPSTYTVVIGQPSLNKLRAIISTYDYNMKFSTSVGIGEVRSDPRESRQADALAKSTSTNIPGGESLAMANIHRPTIATIEEAASVTLSD